MSRLVVVTTPELAPGYGLAGAATVPVANAGEAASELLSLVDGRGEWGVIAVHEPYHVALDRELRRRLDASTEPLVVPLPAGEADREGEGRRERLLKMLWQAVGYEITFDVEGG